MIARVVLGLALLGGVLAACGDDDGASVRVIDDDDASASGSASGVSSGSEMAAECESEADGSIETSLDVDLSEWFVEVDGEVAAGPVNITAHNRGQEAHELVVVRGALADLTVVEGKVDEDSLPEGAFIGEIEAFPAQSECTAPFDLEAGSYVFFCNLVETEDDGSLESHFEEGMVTVVEVG